MKLKTMGINYSESFLFRARCKYCGSIPNMTFVDISGNPLLWWSNKDFQQYSLMYAEKYYKNNIKKPVLWPFASNRSRTSVRLPYLSMNCSLYKNNHQYLGFNPDTSVAMFCQCRQQVWNSKGFKKLEQKQSKKLLKMKGN